MTMQGFMFVLNRASLVALMMKPRTNLTVVLHGWFRVSLVILLVGKLTMRDPHLILVMKNKEMQSRQYVDHVSKLPKYSYC